MANGKGWLDCMDCKHHKIQFDNERNIILEESCILHSINLPQSETIEFKHRFCSDFSPKLQSELIVNGCIIKEENNYFYYVYKPDSQFFENEYNKKIKIEQNQLYFYLYFQPEKIQKYLKINKNHE